MTREELEQIPDFVSLVEAWWDESQSFLFSTTSRVMADWCDDHDFEDRGLTEWMRTGTYPDSEDGFIPEPKSVHRDWLDSVINLHRISTATPVYPLLKRMLDQFGIVLRTRGFGWREIIEESRVLVAPEDCWKVANNREAQAHLQQLTFSVLPRGPVFELFGLPEWYFGWHFLINDEQPVAQIDCVFRDIVLTARVA